MIGSQIVLSAEPGGRFEGIIVSGTPKPGTFMEMLPDTAKVSGRLSYRTRGTTFAQDGGRGPVAILLEDELQGGDYSQAYTSGRHGRIYWPLPGDEFNARLRYQAGTGTSLTDNIGDQLEIDAASGMLQGIGTTGPATAHVTAPFQMIETLDTAFTADTLVAVKYLGSYN